MSDVSPLRKTGGSADIPFPAGKSPVFYGWFIIPLGVIGTLMSIPGQTMGISVFTDYLIEALGLSRSGLSLAYMGGTIGSALVISQAGRLYDRWGVRVTSIASALILSLTLISLSHLLGFLDFIADLSVFDESRSSWAGPAPAWIVMGIMIVAFFLLRFSGQGMLTMVSRNMVMKWFDKRRGMAAAILGVSISFGFSYAPRVLQYLIDDSGWQGAWFKIGLFCLLVFIPLVFIFFRDNPWQCGLVPDSKKGKVVLERKHKTLAPDSIKNYTLEEARRTRVFWTVTLLLTFHSFFATAYTFHVVSIFESIGLDRHMAISIFLPASIISVAVNFGANWLSDYISLKPIMVLHGLSFVIASLGLLFLEQVGIVPLIIGTGMMNGFMSVLSSVAYPRFFGLRHLGAVAGFGMAWMVAGSAVGPYIYSLVLQFSGSYLPVYIVGGLLAAALTIWSLLLPQKG
ncbi:MAG: MFS transporter [Spirochaetales bacterium]|nr:MFS transporter [Spirochaetales bacterium]